MRAGVAMLLLAVMVIGCVAGALSQYGVAMTGNAGWRSISTRRNAIPAC